MDMSAAMVETGAAVPWIQNGHSDDLTKNKHMEHAYQKHCIGRVDDLESPLVSCPREDTKYTQDTEHFS